MAKMGISTLRSYKGAQIADAIGLGKDPERWHPLHCSFALTPRRVACAAYHIQPFLKFCAWVTSEIWS